jgi:hypothetical protein
MTLLMHASAQDHCGDSIKSSQLPVRGGNAHMPDIDYGRLADDARSWRSEAFPLYVGHLSAATNVRLLAKVMARTAAT